MSVRVSSRKRKSVNYCDDEDIEDKTVTEDVRKQTKHKRVKKSIETVMESEENEEPTEKQTKHKKVRKSAAKVRESKENKEPTENKVKQLEKLTKPKKTKKSEEVSDITAEMGSKIVMSLPKLLRATVVNRPSKVVKSPYMADIIIEGKSLSDNTKTLTLFYIRLPNIIL